MAKKRATTKRAVRYVQRSKKTYRTARAAWNKIASTSGLTALQVKPAHTRTHWRWRIK